MNAHLVLFQKKIMYIALVSVLFIWAFIASMMALNNKEQIILVGMDDNGTRIIGVKNDPLFRSEIVNFLKSFSQSLYNFTPTNFSQNVGIAVEFMNDELWKNEKLKYTELLSQVEKDQVSMKSELVRILENQDGTFTLELDAFQKSKILSRKSKVFVTIKLQNVTRTKNNYWGLEVISLDEKYTSI